MQNLLLAPTDSRPLFPIQHLSFKGALPPNASLIPVLMQRNIQICAHKLLVVPKIVFISICLLQAFSFCHSVQLCFGINDGQDVVLIPGFMEVVSCQALEPILYSTENTLHNKTLLL